jgi:heme exporter protein B
MRAWLSLVVETVRKDLLLELRTKQSLFYSAVFAMLVTVVFAFAFERDLGSSSAVGRAALWVSFLFAGIVLVTRTASVETTDAALEGLLLAPADRTALFVGKTLANALFLLLIEGATLVFVSVFISFSLPPAALPLVGVTFVLTAIGFAAVGTLLSLLAVQSRLPALTLPILLVPVVIPVLLGGIELTRAAVGAAPAASWLKVLVAYDGVLLLAGIALFEPIVES